MVMNLGGMGEGSPQPVSYTPRAIGKGKSIQYRSKSGEIQADVGKGVPGTNNAAAFQPRPPPKPPGVKGVGNTGAFVDARA
jgi:hypothetical protein